MTNILVQDWKQAYGWLSMWFSAIVIAWATLPDQYQEAVLKMFGISNDALIGIMGLAIMIGRLINQGPQPVPSNAPDK